MEARFAGPSVSNHLMTSEAHDSLKVLVAQLVDDFRLPKPREELCVFPACA